MFREKILERHRISGVRAGGISVADVPDVKHEIRNFLDNAALGKKLLRVVKETDRFFSGACRVPRAVRPLRREVFAGRRHGTDIGQVFDADDF